MVYKTEKGKRILNVNKKKILFLLFSPLYTKGGHSKNFINIVKYLAQEIQMNDFNARIISFNNTNQDVVINRQKVKQVDFLNTYKIVYFIRRFSSGKVVFQLVEFVLNVFRTFYQLVKYKPDIVYCYADKPLLLSFIWKRILRFKLVFDMRGDTINELKVQKTSRLKLSILAKLYNIAYSNVDMLFSVSDTFKPDKILKVVPKFNYYDGDVFAYNQDQAKQKKKELDLNNKFVFVYTGNSRYYQMIDETIRFFGQFYIKHNNSFLVIISEFGQVNFVNHLKDNNVPNNAWLIKSLKQTEISSLQSIADMALLIRDDLPLNHHSFPTKFAEYLACGVPVLMTPHIHSIAPMVQKHHLGEVITLKEDYSVDINRIYDNYMNNYEKKSYCSDFAKKKLMWQNKAHDIFDLIDKL